MLTRRSKHEGTTGASALAVACALALTAAALGGSGLCEPTARLESRNPLSEVQTARLMAAAVAAARDLLGIDLPTLDFRPEVSATLAADDPTVVGQSDGASRPWCTRMTPDLLDLPPPTC